MRRAATAVFVAGMAALQCCAPPPTAPAHSVSRVVVIGDSVAHGAGDEAALGISGNLVRLLPITVTNLGVNGARTFDVRRVLRTVRARAVLGHADAVIVSIGGNDLYGDSAARLISTIAPALAMQNVTARVRSVVAQIHRLNPAARVFLLGLYDPYQRPWLDAQVNAWDARLIRTFGRDPRVTVIRIADLFAGHDRLSRLDRFHPGSRGYALIAGRIAAAL